MRYSVYWGIIDLYRAGAEMQRFFRGNDRNNRFLILTSMLLNERGNQGGAMNRTKIV